MAKKSNFSGIAKKRPTTARSKTTTTNNTKTQEVTDNKDTLAKKKVDELLKDLPLNRNELLELDESAEITTDKESMAWLQEQLSKLAEDNENLKKVAEEANANYKKLHEDYTKLKENKPGTITDTDLRNNVKIIFNELQTNHFKFGRNFVIAPVAFMNRLVKYFPFLEKERRY